MNTDSFGYDAKTLDAISPKAIRGRPTWKAALLVWGLYVVIAIIAILTLGLTFPLTLGVQLVLSAVAGWVAGWLSDREPHVPIHYGRLGAMAGVLIPLFSTLATVVLGLALGFTTLGISLSGSILSCVCLPVTLHLCLGMGWFGGKLYQGLCGKH